MDILSLKNVHDNRELTFRDIWKIYDEQFAAIRDFLINLGDRFYVESFSGSTDKILHLKHVYTKNQVQVYINGVIQWKNEDYIESSYNTITLLGKRSIKDDIRVVIINSALDGKPIEVINQFYYDRPNEELVVYNDPAYSLQGEELCLATVRVPADLPDEEFIIQREHDYEENEIKYNEKMPNYTKLVCIQGGRTSNIEPPYADIVENDGSDKGLLARGVEYQVGDVVFEETLPSNYRLVCIGSGITNTHSPDYKSIIEAENKEEE